MRILGAVIAGGASRRFGSDKALAEIAGRPMAAHVIAALRPQVDELVICGRSWPSLVSLPDRREGRIGPLAGIESALAHAATGGFDAVLTAPLDTLPLPCDLVVRLGGEGPAVLERQHLIGYWPATCLAALTEHIDGGGRSLQGWLELAAARLVVEPFPIVNVNRPEDLRDL